MKKKYLIPSLSVLRMQTASLCSTSVPVSGETDDEARSNKFWGSSPFGEEETEEEEVDSWF